MFLTKTSVKTSRHSKGRDLSTNLGRKEQNHVGRQIGSGGFRGRGKRKNSIRKQGKRLPDQRWY